MGLGSSIASGLPDLAKLTDEVQKQLTGADKKFFEELRAGNGNLETILNRLRALCEILRGADSFHGLTEDSSKLLDSAICGLIYKIIAADDPNPSPAHLSFAQWVQHSQRNVAVEVFTSNYDLLFEVAFELIGLPYFDGFIGAVKPFFAPQSVDPLTPIDVQRSVPPLTWARLWKLHGSVGWRFVTDAISKQKKIIRVIGLGPKPGEEVVIYPSRDKYSESRRLPYLTYMDRFRRYLVAGERIFIVCGYSFGDEHINEVIAHLARPTEGYRAGRSRNTTGRSHPFAMRTRHGGPI